MIAGTDFVLADFGQFWPTVRERAEKWVNDECIEASRGHGYACLCNDDGMLVVTLKPTVDNRWQAFVQMAVSTGKPGAFKRNEESMLAIARDMGATSLGFRADRRGWARLLGPEWRQSGKRHERGL